MRGNRRAVLFRPSSSPANEEIRIAVARMQALTIWAPHLIFLLLWVLFVMIGLTGRGVVDAVLVAMVTGFVGSLCGLPRFSFCTPTGASATNAWRRSLPSRRVGWLLPVRCWSPGGRTLQVRSPSQAMAVPC